MIFSTHPAHHLEAERERRHIEEQRRIVARPGAGQKIRLHRRTERHHLIRIDVAERFAAEEFAHEAPHRRRPRGPADQDDTIQIARLELRVLERAPAGPARAYEDGCDRLLELRSRHRHRPPVEGRDGRLFIRQIVLEAARQLEQPAPFALDCVRQVAVAELLQEQLGQRTVEVVPAERRVAAGGLHLEHTGRELEDGDVEGAATEVIDRVRPFRALVEAIGERRGRRLVEQPQYLQPRQPARVLGRLALRIVEVGRHRDHRAIDRPAHLRLGALAQPPQDLGRDLDRRHVLAAGHAKAHHRPRLRRELVGRETTRDLGVARSAAHEALHRDNRVLGPPRRIRERLGAHHRRPVAKVLHHRRQEPLARSIHRQTARDPAHHRGHERMRRAEIDAHHPHRLALLLGLGLPRLADLEQSTAHELFSSSCASS